MIPGPRDRHHPRPVFLPGPRQAPGPALHPWQHRPGRDTGKNPVDYLQAGLDRHRKAPGVADAEVQVRGGIPALQGALGGSGRNSTHLVPLELGGSNDATNLWPETPPTPNPKDKVEQVLNHAACDRRVSLAAAQLAIARDWLTAESKLGLGGGGGGGGSGAWYIASASYNATYGDYDIYVHSNQLDKWATATASNGASHGYWTNGSGYVDIFLRAASSDTVTVTVGTASCSTTA
jgi:hypothetical protein